MVPADWQQLPVRKLATLHSGGTPSKAVAAYWNGDIPWFTAKDLKSFRLIRSVHQITPAGAESGTRMVSEGAILILVRGMTLLKDVPLGVTTRSSAFNQDLRAVVPRDGIDPDYLAYALIAKRRRLQGYVNIAGHGTGRLETDFLAELPILVAPHVEQRAITRILNTWERAIVCAVELLKAKRRLRRGLIQELSAGRRRFPEFRRQPWRTCRIGHLLKDVNRYVSVDASTVYRLVSIRRRSGGFFDRPPCRGCDIAYARLKTIEAGDFVIARRQVLHGAMSMARPELAGAYVSDAYATLIPRSPNELYMPFFDYLSQTPSMYHRALRCSYGVAIEKMFFNLDWFLAENVAIPPTIDEQKKIADTLNTLDREIEALRSYAERLRIQKKGLMQRLLTGKVRVPVKRAQ